MQRKELNELMDFAVEFGARVMTSGGEIWRTDDLLHLIFHAYGIEEPDIFMLPHTLMISVQPEDQEPVMRHKTVGDILVNMEQLTQLNRLAWEIRDNHIPVSTLKEKLHAISIHPPYPRPMIICGMAIALLSLNYFIGGGVMGGVLVSIGIAIAMGTQMYMHEIFPVNHLLLCGISSFLAGSVIMIGYKTGLHSNPYLLMIINCIGLIPGIPLINACREMLNGRVLSGGLLFMTAFLETLAVACGFYLSLVIFGGVL
ncbi:MAG: threonine/serine exporter family protein [Lachnospiraceae bacterium]|nr:threonine/serine exporter family protein [Lachnospiraceae bacterium]